MGDFEDRLTSLETKVSDLTTTLGELVEQLRLTNLAQASASVKPRVCSKKKWVVEEDRDGGTEEVNSNSSDVESVKERSGIGKSSNHIRNLRINFKIEILVFDGSIDAEMLDNWLDRLETYFFVYEYSNAQKICFSTLKFFEQSVQDYTTAFHNQALVLDIDVDEYEMFMKYTGGFSESIRRELKLFTVANIEDATVKAIAIEGKYLKSDKEDDKNKSGYKSSWKYKHKGESKGEGSSSKENYCNHFFGYRGGELGKTFSCQYQVKQSLVEAIIDRERCGFDDHEAVYITITERFIDKVTREVVPLDVCQVILGSPYLWDRDAIHYRRARKYRLVKEGKEFHINVCKEHVTTNNLVTATQVKRLVNASGKFVLLVRPVQKGTSARVLSTMTASYKQQTDIGKLYEEVVVHSDHRPFQFLAPQSKLECCLQ
ncbi:hypothetical protein GIB67_005179 [Kingdonia uniflora]|uniref:Retrotransposon gag domain-containing protein n=1 Tax=Kingdonia uniflora TaxID=39325 RepID=A0A7J7NMW9_9MAGN|nr:hypothetical protein GIB67_005179 [Kingdonia uniflora]